MAREKMRLIIGVVDACYQDVLKGEPLFLMRYVVIACGKQFLDVKPAIDRHDLIADFISCAMQRDRQTNLQRLIGELLNLRHESAGRNRDVPRPDAESPRRVDDSNRAQD